MSEFTADLPRRADSVQAARRLVALHAVPLSEPQIADACLMVSELVTNALLHGTGAITLRIATRPERVTVEVSDDGHGKVAIAPQPGVDGGWGLRLVDELADAWGAERGSTPVWFRIAI
jgi:anti-sigma regulatory factor (Ser/Thr protein kinase)